MSHLCMGKLRSVLLFQNLHMEFCYVSNHFLLSMILGFIILVEDWCEKALFVASSSCDTTITGNLFDAITGYSSVQEFEQSYYLMFQKFGYGFAHSTDPYQTVVFCAAWSGSTLHSGMSVQIFSSGNCRNCMFVCLLQYMYALNVGDLPRSLLRTVFVFCLWHVGSWWRVVLRWTDTAEREITLALKYLPPFC